MQRRRPVCAGRYVLVCRVCHGAVCAALSRRAARHAAVARRVQVHGNREVEPCVAMDDRGVRAAELCGDAAAKGGAAGEL